VPQVASQARSVLDRAMPGGDWYVERRLDAAPRRMTHG
jgi:hypothetical protein